MFNCITVIYLRNDRDPENTSHAVAKEMFKERLGRRSGYATGDWKTRLFLHHQSIMTSQLSLKVCTKLIRTRPKWKCTKRSNVQIWQQACSLQWWRIRRYIYDERMELKFSEMEKTYCQVIFIYNIYNI